MSQDDDHPLARRLAGNEDWAQAEKVANEMDSLAEGFAPYVDAIDRAAAELLEELSAHTPDEAYRLTREATSDTATAMKVRFGVWEKQTRALNNEDFDRIAREIERTEVLASDYPKRMVVLDEERERRGFPQMKLPRNAMGKFFRLNSRIARGDVSEKTRRSAAIAQAAWRVGVAREERSQASAG